MTKSINKPTSFALSVILIFTMAFGFILASPTEAKAADEQLIRIVPAQKTFTKAGDVITVNYGWSNASAENITISAITASPVGFINIAIPTIIKSSSISYLNTTYTITDADVKAKSVTFSITATAESDTIIQPARDFTASATIFLETKFQIDVVPTIKDNTTYTEFKIANANFFDDFDGGDGVTITVDGGKPLPLEHATVRSGSVIVTLKAAFLKTLSNGPHVLFVSTANGASTATTTFYVDIAGAGNVSYGAANASTSDGAALWTWVTILTLAALTISASAFVLRKRIFKKP